MLNPSNFPIDLSIEIISYLDLSSLKTCNLLSKQWKAITDLFLRTPKQMKFNDEVIKSVQAFLVDVRWWRNALFVSPLGSGQMIIAIDDAQKGGFREEWVRKHYRHSDIRSYVHTPAYDKTVEYGCNCTRARWQMDGWNVRMVTAMRSSAAGEAVWGTLLLRVPSGVFMHDLAQVDWKIRKLFCQKLEQLYREKLVCIYATAAVIVLVIAYLFFQINRS